MSRLCFLPPVAQKGPKNLLFPRLPTIEIRPSSSAFRTRHFASCVHDSRKTQGRNRTVRDQTRLFAGPVCGDAPCHADGAPVYAAAIVRIANAARTWLLRRQSGRFLGPLRFEAANLWTKATG